MNIHYAKKKCIDFVLFRPFLTFFGELVDDRDA